VLRRDDIARHLTSEVVFAGDRWPGFSDTIQHPGGLVLVDTGMIDTTPELDEEWQPTPHPLPDELVSRIAVVVNTHLHFDHCGGNRRFAGTPTYVQRAELEAAVEPDYLVEWVHFDGESYVEVDGDAELFDGVSTLFTPGHSAGHQAVLVDTRDGLVVLGGDVTYSMRDLIDGATPSILRIHALRPQRVYLAHHERAWEPGYS
jgi:N-acyl homoserine lactone hydrolase